MTRTTALNPAPLPSTRGVSLALWACLALAGAALAAEFLIACGLMADHDAPGLLRPAWGVLAGGLLSLAALGVLVHAALVRPYREAALRLEQLAQALEQHSHRDPLTGALNRTAYEQLAARELEALRRYGAGFCGIMLDADGLRRVNESHGYEAGDLALHELGMLLKRSVRKADLLFRWRSGKFLVLATGIGPEQAQILADKLRRLVDAHEFRPGVRLTAWTGVAQAQAEDSPEQFAARAKAALVLERERGAAARREP